MNVEMLNIPVDAIRPAPWNPRRQMDPTADKQLAESFLSIGIIEPIVVRRVEPAEPAFPQPGEELPYELVAGSRRLEAAKGVAWSVIPAVVHDSISDRLLAEVAMSENILAESLTPLDEANGYKYLVDEHQMPPSEIARRLAVPVSRVRRRLRLLNLHVDVTNALHLGRISVQHADLLAAVPVDKQTDGLKVCVRTSFFDSVEEAQPVSQLRRWIADSFPADVDDEEFVEDYFPELVEDRPVKVGMLIKLSDQHHCGVDDILGKQYWCEIGDEHDYRFDHDGPVPDCDRAEDGVVVVGGPIRVLRVCATEHCPVHRPAPPDPDDGADAADGAGNGPGVRAAVRGQAAERERQKAERERRAKEEADRKAWEKEKGEVKLLFARHVEDLPITLQLLTDTCYLGDVVKQLQKMLGEGWKPEDHLGQILAYKTVIQHHMWERADFRNATKPYGFKMPRRAPAKPKRKTARKSARKTAPKPEADNA